MATETSRAVQQSFNPGVLARDEITSPHETRLLTGLLQDSRLDGCDALRRAVRS
jgi:hypothetical protein